MRLAPRLGGPLGLSNLGRSLAVFFGCSSSIRNASVSSEPESISSCKRERNGLVSMIVEVIYRLKRTLVQTITEKKIINASISIIYSQMNAQENFSMQNKIKLIDT